MKHIFSGEKVNRLRRRAQRVIEFPDNRKEGRAKSSVDAMQLLDVFSALWIREGFILRGYTFRSGGNGNGII